MLAIPNLNNASVANLKIEDGLNYSSGRRSGGGRVPERGTGVSGASERNRGV